jgi:hypothetical protein
MNFASFAIRCVFALRILSVLEILSGLRIPNAKTQRTAKLAKLAGLHDLVRRFFRNRLLPRRSVGIVGIRFIGLF